mmetsp:Transcript_15635/g.23038  ORF Transcript_15635/g.23038 Transcript_15635/m.23038 type:complete len:371 (-) Transcript_15635:242-1354(-)|eukprot:CAMPEP_0194225940 /NCGR_PEP_ID=MMETSP0156-20130528/40720_1 /TAXON_ID=33649 /ORGANISM="Thalassionema nitzschioides, Strain L26-B" /LENGTH=370 /DNA_ID=CAMNT_0038958095 /DNA_START=515 /DNA_END=1627 /DNA_ORIENTATION=+
MKQECPSRFSAQPNTSTDEHEKSNGEKKENECGIDSPLSATICRDTEQNVDDNASDSIKLSPSETILGSPNDFLNRTQVEKRQSRINEDVVSKIQGALKRFVPSRQQNTEQSAPCISETPSKRQVKIRVEKSTVKDLQSPSHSQKSNATSTFTDLIEENLVQMKQVIGLIASDVIQSNDASTWSESTKYVQESLEESSRQLKATINVNSEKLGDGFGLISDNVGCVSPKGVMEAFAQTSAQNSHTREVNLFGQLISGLSGQTVATDLNGQSQDTSVLPKVTESGMEILWQDNDSIVIKNCDDNFSDRDSDSNILDDRNSERLTKSGIPLGESLSSPTGDSAEKPSLDGKTKQRSTKKVTFHKQVNFHVYV